MSNHDVAFKMDLPAAQEAAVRDLGDKQLADSLNALASLALKEWLEWLVADDRPASLTEVSKRRVKSLVDDGLLPAIPSAPVIAQRARLTLGQARYIVTALALENPAGTAAARAGLIHRLEEALKDRGIDDPRGADVAGIARIAGDAPIEIDVPRQWADVASATHEELLNEQFGKSDMLDIDTFEQLRRRRTDSFVELSLRPHVAGSILRRLIQAGA